MSEKKIRIYTMFDRTLPEEDDDYDVTGDDYKKLITRLFKYSSCFSLSFNAPELAVTSYPEGSSFISKGYFYGYDNRGDYPEYDKYIIKKVSVKPPQNVLGTCFGYELRFYRCCDETLEFLLTKFDSIFSLTPDLKDNHNPEDPYFYRSDGSVLFASEIHEGECWLMHRDNEDFTDILNEQQWYGPDEITEDFYYRRFCKFAHEHMSIEEFNL